MKFNGDPRRYIRKRIERNNHPQMVIRENQRGAPVTPSEALNAALDLLPSKMRSAQAIVTLLAIQLQEAPNQEQRQIGGPAL